MNLCIDGSNLIYLTELEVGVGTNNKEKLWTNMKVSGRQQLMPFPKASIKVDTYNNIEKVLSHLKFMKNT